MQSLAAQSQPPAHEGETVKLTDRYGILPRARLPALDSPTAEAYQVVDLHGGAANLYALVCAPRLPARNEALPGFAQIVQMPLVVPEEWGVIDWPPERGRRMALVLHQPVGTRLLAPGADEIPRMREDELKYRVLIPLMPALKAMSLRSLTHCAIRLDNLFYGDAEGKTVMLGEGVSGPPGYAQPAVYETIERAMAIPAGRGPGRQGDDLYALGVALMLLLLGRDPCAGMSAEEIVAAKLSRGTYALFVGGDRLSLPLMELFRGLLCDDTRERWNLPDLEAWVAGRRMSPKQPSLPPKTQRPFELAGQNYWTARTLAHAMANNWDEACAAVDAGRLVEWVRRSLADEARANAISDTIQSCRAKASSPALARDLSVALALIVLDPQAPLRFKSLAANVDQLGPALAIEFDRKDVRTAYAEIIRGRLPQAWFVAQQKIPAERNHVRKDFDQAGDLLAQWGSEAAIVYCLYEFNSDWPCQSPLVQRDHVLGAGELLASLDRLAAEGAPDTAPLDLHIAAFCAVRLRRTPKRLLERLLQPGDEGETRLATLDLLAQVQRQDGPGRVPHLAAWLVRRLGPSLEGFHNRVYREELRKAVSRLAQEGDLKDLSSLINNPGVRQQDVAGFAQAQAYYQQIINEIKWLEAGGLTNRQHIMRGSRHVSTIISAVLSGIGLIVLTLGFAM